MDNDDDPDLADLMQRIDRMNAKQRGIVGGVLATLQAFDDDDAAAGGSNSTSSQSSTSCGAHSRS